MRVGEVLSGVPAGFNQILEYCNSEYVVDNGLDKSLFNNEDIWTTNKKTIKC